MRCPASLLVVLVACLAACRYEKAPESPQSRGVGCPTANNVYVASYVTPQRPDAHRAGWVLPLSDAPLAAGKLAPDYATVTSDDARAANVPPPPTATPWIVTPGAAPCPARVSHYYAARVDRPTPNLSYGVELDGCPAPVDPQDVEALVLVSAAPPTDCRVEAPQPLAARLGDVDDHKQWHPPTKATPIPDALAATIPAHACQAPGCEQLWAFAQIVIDNRAVAWSGAVNWLAVGALDKPCDWQVDTFSGFFVPGADGKPVKVDAGSEHALVLSGALVDRGGAKVLLAQGPGEYATFDLAPTGATVGHHVVWMLAPPEAYRSVDRIGPVCEPGAGQGPPAAAAPQSPY